MWSDFHFVRPWWLLLLLPLGWLVWRLLRQRGEGSAWRRVVDAHLLDPLLDRGSGPASRLPLALLASGWLLLVLALAGPAWERLPQPVYQAQQYRVVALDLSLPMNVADVRPSRLAQARFKVIDLLQQVEEGQTALIGFGAEPYVVSPLTGDAATIVAQVPLLETALLPVTGPARVDLALRQAGELLRQAGAPSGEVILIGSDGGETDRSVAAARALADSGFRVSVLGVGTDEGAPLPLPGGGFVQAPGGGFVISRLDADALARIADAGGGRYVRSTPGGEDVERLRPDPSLRFFDPALQQDNQAEQWREEGPWLLLLLLPLAALAFRRGWLAPPVLLLAAATLPPTEAHAVTWDEIWLRDDQRAMRSLEAGDAARAAELFERPDWRAAAAYRAGDYDRALEILEAPGAEQGADYNAGNALAHLGRLEDAIAAYDEALQVDPDDEDARHNREVVRRLLEQREAQARRETERDEPSEQQQDADQAEQRDDAQQAQAEQQDAEQQEDGGPDDSEQQGQAAQGPQTAEASEPDPSADTEGADSEPQDAEQDGEAADAADGDGQAEAGEGTRDGEQAGSRQADTDEGDGGDRGGTADAGTGDDPETAEQSGGTETTGETVDDGEQAQTGSPGPDGDEPQQDEGRGDDTTDELAALDSEGPSGADGNREQVEGADGGPPDGEEAAGGSGPEASGPDAAGRQAAADATRPGPQDPGRAPDREDLMGGQPATSGAPGPGGDMQAEVTGGDVETAQALEQMLRRVDEDPGGLLRQRFLLQHLRRSGQLR